MDVDPAVRATSLGHRYGRQWLFRHLDLALAPAQRLLVQGPNGSGKSTLLKIVAGLVEPTEGDVEAPPLFGYAGLDLGLFPHQTVEEHLLFAARVRGVPVNTSLWLETVGLTGAGFKKGSELSTGMAMRLKIALATLHQPDLLLLDEPTAPLDSDGKEWLRQFVRDYPGTVVLATNDPHDKEAATHALRLD